MFGSILVHAIVFNFIFDFSLPVQIGRSNFAGHGYGVAPWTQA